MMNHCQCVNPDPSTCTACSAVLQLPTPAAIERAMRTLPAGKALDAIARAFEAGKVRVTAIAGGFGVKSFTGEQTYIVNTLADRCSCPSRKPVCKHRMAIQLIEQAWARPACTALPDVEQTLAWAERLTLDSMPRLTKSRAVVLAEMDELFS